MERVRLIFWALVVLFVPTQHLYSHDRVENARSNQFSRFEENGKVGLKDEEGQVLIPPIYDAIGWSNGKLTIIDKTVGYKSNGLWGLIHTSNKLITPAEFLELNPGEGSLLVAQKKSRLSQRPSFGVISTSGKTVIPLQYDGLRLSNMRAIVMSRTGLKYLFGLTDLSHKILIPLKFQNIYSLGSLRYAVEDFENKTAIFSDEGNQVTDFTIDSLSAFKKNYAIVYENQRLGLVDRNGKMVLKAVYGGVEVKDDGTVQVRDSDTWFFLTGENKLSRRHEADGIRPMSSDHYLVSQGGKVQLTDNDFKPLHEGLFYGITDLGNGLFLFRKASRVGVINHQGGIVIPSKYQAIFPSGKGFVASQDTGYKNRWVVLDTEGRTLTKKQYEEIASFNGRFYPVRNRGFWGAVDETGLEIITCVHDSLIQQKEEHVVVKFKDGYGIITVDENWIVAPQSNPLRILNNNAYLEFDGKTTFLKSFSGDIIYFSDNVLEYNGGYLREHLATGAYWTINLEGIIIDRSDQPEKTERIFAESEGLRAILKDGKYGFIDNAGRLRIANRYEDFKSFQDGMAAIRIRNKWGFIDQRETLAVQPVYDHVENFYEGYAIVKQNGLSGLIDRSGKIVLPLRYGEIALNQHRRYTLRLGTLSGMADETGNVIIHPKYDEVMDTGNGYVIAQRDGKFGLLTLRGVSTIPMIYDGLVYDSFRGQYLAVKKSEWRIITPAN
jgi:hypothetical protein